MSHPLYMVIYDITDNRERSQVAKVLEGFGIRVQYSAFECRMNRGMRERMITALQKVAPETGGIRMYRIREESRVRTIGREPGPAGDPLVFVC